jgi:hypothetical protein
MTVGTKSLLFGVHNIVLHPIFIAMAWRRLYGFPLDFRLWCCFILHDIGYFGKKDMDGETEGQTHPRLGANIIRKLFGNGWGDFCLFHSRFYSKTNNCPHSKLCTADKLAFCMYPVWLYIFLAKISGELKLYREFSADVCHVDNQQLLTDKEWYHSLKRYTLRVVVSTNKTYKIYANAGRSYHARSSFNNRVLQPSVRGKEKGWYYDRWDLLTSTRRGKQRKS